MEEKNKIKKKIGILGGSFDPPTIGHLQIACEIYNNLDDIDEVWIVPCGDGRSDKKLRTPSEHRVKMLNIILEEIVDPNTPVKIDLSEIQLGKYTPTIYLLQHLQKTHPNYEFLFCIGSDLLQGLKEWDEPEKLTKEYEFIIINREGYSIKLDDPNCMYPVRRRILNTSYGGASTEIRNRIKKITENMNDKENLTINGLTTPGVIKYIKENNLYGLKK